MSLIFSPPCSCRQWSPPWSFLQVDSWTGGTWPRIFMFMIISSQPFFFEAALSVNLTTMLVMTTIFISKMESLPSTSDIKMIDIWLVLCQMIPFAEVVLLTAREYHRDDEEIGGTLLSINKIENDDQSESAVKRCQGCQSSTFKTLGNKKWIISIYGIRTATKVSWSCNSKYHLNTSPLYSKTKIC